MWLARSSSACVRRLTVSLVIATDSGGAADAEAFDGADRDLLHLLPGTAQSRSQFEMPAQRTDIHGAARPAFGVLQVEAGAERLGAAPRPTFRCRPQNRARRR